MCYAAGMGFWSGKGQGELAAKVIQLETTVLELEKRFRQLREECSDYMDRAYRHRKAAEARKREDSAGQGRTPDGASPPEQGSPAESAESAARVSLRRRVAWGARGRRLARQAAPASDNGETPEG